MGQTNAPFFKKRGYTNWAHALVNTVGFLNGFVNMYELHQRAEIEMGLAQMQKKKQNTFKIQNMQIHRFLLNSSVCITSNDTVCESSCVPLV